MNNSEARKIKIGIPKGLLYYELHPFLITFFRELQAEIVVSQDTNKRILDLGEKCCENDVCLPIKVFHGHVVYLKNKCDIMLIPRVIQIRSKEFVCSKFLNIQEMIFENIKDLPIMITDSVHIYSKKKLYQWSKLVGQYLTNDIFKIKNAFFKGVEFWENFKVKTNQYESLNISNNKIQNNCEIQNEKLSENLNIALIGQSYNIYDDHINLNIQRKLEFMGVKVKLLEITEDFIINIKTNNILRKHNLNYHKNENQEIESIKDVHKLEIDNENYDFQSYNRFNFDYGTKIHSDYNTIYNLKNKKLKNGGYNIDGIIYITSSNCSIDNTIMELIKNNVEKHKILCLKIDEYMSYKENILFEIQSFISHIKDNENIKEEYETNKLRIKENDIVLFG